jgi:iron complex outermembrane receptor protein
VNKPNNAPSSNPLRTFAGGRRQTGAVPTILFAAVVAVVAALPPNSATAQATGDIDLTALSLEDLLNVEVYSASKFPQKMSEAPSYVTVVTAADIKTYGYRTLADILRSVPGLYVSYDRQYNFLGVRGFSRPGDYNSRILLLVDGNRLNDAVYDTASIGTEFPIDVDLIDRVEFVAGPGSSIYGSNAFFGVINVITRNGRGIGGVEVAGSVASAQTAKGRVTAGGVLDSGLDWILSATYYGSKGKDLYFPAFDTPETNNGVAQGLDYDRYASFFGKASYGGWTLEAAWADRKKGVPINAFANFNDPDTYVRDPQGWVDLRYNGPLTESTDLLARVFYGKYPYEGDYVYGGELPSDRIVNRDGSRSTWWGTEAKFVSKLGDSNKLVYGVEYVKNLQQDQFNYDVDPPAVYTDTHAQSSRWGVYVQDDVTLRKNLVLNAGVRYDDYGSGRASTNPRVALIWNPVPAGALKLIYGTAFRAPNSYETDYAANDSQKANPDLLPERIQTYEVIYEQIVERNSRFSALVFQNRIKNLISGAVDPADGLFQFNNLGRVKATGGMVSLERNWENGYRARASYSYQQAVDETTGERLTNSPENIVTLNASTPALALGVRAGLEAQYVSSRKTALGTTGGYTLVNLTLRNTTLVKNLELSASVYNLLDQDYGDPATEDLALIGVDTIAQDGRTWQLKLVYRF